MKVQVLESLVLVTLVSLLLRWCVARYSYSGAGLPPMYGDYEAQRHWQEITVNLPVSDWYTNSSTNDLQYWGLDYPPLTAYHSYIVGLVARAISPDYVALNTSRGYESGQHKLFMRYTVFVADILVYVPAVLLVAMAGRRTPASRASGKLCFVGLMTYPGIYLIDYGHFQYNCVSLGLFLGAVTAVSVGMHCFGSLLFSMSLCYKQMELYHALPFFFFLLGKCIEEETYQRKFIKLATIGGTVVLTFLVVWAPFLGSYATLSQVLNRVFPIDRGLFEDKVASFWCSLSILIKFKSLLADANMAFICLVVTFLLSLPSCIHLLRYPTSQHFRYSLVNVSLVFFLFSFHVHEKSILLVTAAAGLLYAEEPLAVCWLYLTSLLSMLPLLDKDGLFVPYVSLTLLSALLYSHHTSVATTLRPIWPASVQRWWLPVTVSCIAVLTLAYKTMPAPARYPHLLQVLLALISCSHFMVAAVYFLYRQFTIECEGEVGRSEAQREHVKPSIRDKKIR